MKYSDFLVEELVKEGYTTCFSVGGGNIMHLAESASTSLDLIPVVHEATAVMAAEAFNATSQDGGKAFVLVTTGPGLTNSITGIAGAHLEAREVLVIGGQVKTVDLSDGSIRQLGIQEIDGVELTSSITLRSARMLDPWNSSKIQNFIRVSPFERPGPVFLEIPIDIQGREFTQEESFDSAFSPDSSGVGRPVTEMQEAYKLLGESRRPVLLIGGGVSYNFAQNLEKAFLDCEIPLMTTWNGADRIDNFTENYMGRPNTWGQRFSNVLIQQSDMIIAVGTRLGLQQTGFNWQEFAPQAKIIQVEIDSGELNKPRPKKSLSIQWDADLFLSEFLQEVSKLRDDRWKEWMAFCKQVKATLPLSETCNADFKGFWNPYDFFISLSSSLSSGDRLIPSSSGSSFTVGYQASTIKSGVRMLSSKSLASMGHGLGMALGAALTSTGTTVLVEGDGGFAQNMQDLGTLAGTKRNIKIFIWDNGGYGSIRTTQKSYFGGHYVGCDEATGLYLPNWEKFAESFGIPISTLETSNDMQQMVRRPGIEIFLVKIHPEQTFFPKITSRVLPDGGMESNPLHLMSPALDEDTFNKVWKIWG